MKCDKCGTSIPEVDEDADPDSWLCDTCYDREYVRQVVIAQHAPAMYDALTLIADKGCSADQERAKSVIAQILIAASELETSVPPAGGASVTAYITRA